MGVAVPVQLYLPNRRRAGFDPWAVVAEPWFRLFLMFSITNNAANKHLCEEVRIDMLASLLGKLPTK